MSKVSRGFGTSLLLDPHQYSLDPDWPDDKVCCKFKVSHLNFLWQIKEINEIYLRKGEGRTGHGFVIWAQLAKSCNDKKTKSSTLLGFHTLHFILPFFLLHTSCIQNFTYTWFCRTLDEPEHRTDDENRPQVHNIHRIREPFSDITGDGCFGKGPGDYVMTSLNSTLSLSHLYDEDNEVKWIVKWEE